MKSETTVFECFLKHTEHASISYEMWRNLSPKMTLIY